MSVLQNLAGLLNLPGINASGSGGSFWLPPAASTVAPGVDWVFYLIYWISVIFFVLIVAVMLLFIIRYRRREEGEAVEQSTSHNTPLEITWTVIPLLLVIWIFWVGFQKYLDMRVAPANSYQVGVTAQTWNWTFTYPNGYVDGVLHVPVDVPIALTMTSQDYIHSFFVPAFRVKMDVVPGRYTKAWFQATKTGEYQIFCTEYCGTGHSDMRSQVIVHTTAEFEAWLREAADFITTLPPAEAGRRVYEIRGCKQCHSVDGARGIGPTFQGIWGKTEVLTTGEQVTVEENYVRRAILEPQSEVVAGYEPVMPVYAGQLRDDEITVLIQFIKSLTPGAIPAISEGGETPTPEGADASSPEDTTSTPGDNAPSPSGEQ